MKLAEPHRRLLADVLAVGAPYPLVLAGGDAVRAHGLVDRPSRDVDVATESAVPMEEIASAVRAGLDELGWTVRPLGTDPLAARLGVTEPSTGEECELQVLKEALWHPPVVTELGLTISLEDVVGMKVRALADRGFARDLIDVHAASDRFSHPELEELARRHAGDTFDLTDLQARLTGAEWLDDSQFAAYGLDETAIAQLRRWAQQWADDIAERLVEGEPPQDE
ncbi:nucleotidyl transferase AbiEii/AbiGii toxin family protein [Streptomyces sp. NPDC051104]|uniref:nucleotidyl transferase AbiEii/AbiGii toxin family protein n=1 Tax=Streptomyces sp. NPDC051104 TaxID=3155044 RepID=UPI0034339561